jgi:hypothetical protein
LSNKGVAVKSTATPLLLIEALKVTKKFLKVPLRGTFKNFFGFYKSVKRCMAKKKLYCTNLRFINNF